MPDIRKLLYAALKRWRDDTQSRIAGDLISGEIDADDAERLQRQCDSAFRLMWPQVQRACGGSKRWKKEQ